MKKIKRKITGLLAFILAVALLMPVLSVLVGAASAPLAVGEPSGERSATHLALPTDYANDNRIYDRLLGNNTGFDHPYLFANEDEFAAMRKRYASGTDATYVEYVSSVIAEVDKYVTTQTGFTADDIKNGNYSYEKIKGSLPVNPYTTNGGYDVGGRLNVLSEPLNANGTGSFSSILRELAFAYQLTGNSFYAEFAYDWTVALCNWEHWGPGHFLNAAGTMSYIALSYDWLYDYYVENGKDVNVIRNAIFEKGVAEGYIGAMEWYTEYTSSLGVGYGIYHETPNNWNPVCTNGMLIAAFSIMNDFEGDKGTTFTIGHYVDSDAAFSNNKSRLIWNTYSGTDAMAQAKYVVNDNIHHLYTHGLNFFSEDGSYSESSGYWAGSVRSLYSIFALLDYTIGDDFGFMDIPKLLKTAYYGVHIESSDYKSWPYHDDSARQLEHSWYYYIAMATGAYDLAGIRKEELENGKRVFMWDIFYYDAIALAQEAILPLDFAMNDIDGFVSRDSWNPGSLYTGIMGGSNAFGAHAHIDSGNWIYDNDGVRWFTDLGMDSYTLYTKNGVTKYHYYRNGGEGQNNLILVGHDSDLPYGQVRANNIGNLERYADDLGYKGAYAIINNDTTYGSYVQSAKRGMLVTNDRNTVVIQDEVVTANGTPETFWWFAHYTTGEVKSVKISEDGRTAYMMAITPSGATRVLRVSIVSDNESLAFTIKDTYNDFVLENTVKPGYSVSMGGTDEANRSTTRKLAIKAENVTSLNLAVVIELIGDESDELGYKEIIPMSEWNDDTVKEGTTLTEPTNVGYTVYYKDGTSVRYDTAAITQSAIKNVDVVKIVCHGSVTISNSTVQLANGQNLIIDLCGNILVQSAELQLGDSDAKAEGTSLTILNGTVISSNTIMTRSGTALIMKDVTVRSNILCLIRNNRFSKLVFDGCVVELGQFLFASNIVSDNPDAEHSLIIKDTTLSVGKGLFKYGNGRWYNAYPENLNLYILGDSALMYGKLNNLVVNGGVDDYITYSNGKSYPIDPGGERNFYVASGAKLSSEGLPLPESADGQNFSTFYYNYIDVDESYAVTLGARLDTQYDFVKSDITYNGNPIYTVTDTTEYEIVFVDYDGRIISREKYFFGDAITLPTAPNRASDNVYKYVFAGWGESVTTCKGNATYTATYTAEYVDYTVIFKDTDGTVFSTSVYHFGDAVVAPAKAPTKESDGAYTYTFSGWDKEVVSCKGNATYTATYVRVPIGFAGTVVRSVTLDERYAAELRSAGFVALRFASEAEFLAAIENNDYDALYSAGMTEFVHPTPGETAYVYLLESVSTNFPTGMSVKGTDFVFNLGGNSITYSTSAGGSGHWSLTYVNGTFIENKGTQTHGLLRVTAGSANLTLIDLTVKVGGRTFSVEDGNTFNLFADGVTFEESRGSTFLYTGGVSETATTNRGGFKAIFNNVTTNMSIFVLKGYTNSAEQNAPVCSLYLSGRIELEGLFSDHRQASDPITVNLARDVIAVGTTLGILKKAPVRLVIPDGLELIDYADGYILGTAPEMEFTASDELLAAGHGAFIVYASTIDFLSDLDNGVIDGFDAMGNNLIVGDAKSAFPSRGYVCLLSDYVISGTATVATVEVGTSLTVNMGGHKLQQNTIAITVDEITTRYTAFIVNGIMSYLNGEYYENFSHNTAVHTFNAGSVLIVRGVDLSTNSPWENWSNLFYLNSATATFEDCNVTMNGKKTSVIFLSGSSTVNLKNVTFADYGDHVDTVEEGIAAKSSNIQAPGFMTTKSSGANTVVNIDANTKVLAGRLFNAAWSYTYVKDGDVITDIIFSSKYNASYTINVEVGFVTHAPSHFTDISELTLGTNTVNYLKNGSPITEIRFVLDGAYYVLSESKVVSVSFYDEQGNLLDTSDWTEGETPTLDYVPTGYKIGADGKVYVITAGGWALTEGGEIVEITAITRLDESRVYYYVTTQTLAAVVVYGAGGDIVDAWVDNNLTKAQVKAAPAGGRIQLQMDCDADRGANINRFNEYNDGLVIDLGGFILSHSNAVGGNKRWCTVEGKTLTIQNGTMVVVGVDNLFMPEQDGLIKLINVDCIGGTGAYYPVFDYRGGNVEMYGGSIEATRCGVFALSQYVGTDVNIKLMGVEVNAAGKTFISTKLLADRANSITIGAYEGKPTTIKSASFIIVSAGTDLTEASKLTIDISDTYALLANGKYNPIEYASSVWALGDSATLERSNVKITVNNFYSNYALGSSYGNATFSKGVDIALTNAGDYRYACVSAPSVDRIEASITLYADFNFNLFIPVGSNIRQLLLADEIILDVNDPTTYELVDGYYKTTIKGIAPNELAKKIAITIRYTVLNDNLADGAVTAQVVGKYSIAKYLISLVGSTDEAVTENYKHAARVIAAYSAAAYDYFTETAAYDEALLAQLEALVTEDVLAEIDGVDFESMDDDRDFRDESVSAGFSANDMPVLTLTFEDGVAWSVTGAGVRRSGVGGICVLNLRASILSDEFIITAGGESATFSLGEYIAARMKYGAQETELAALRAFYAYGIVAKALVT